MPPSAYAEHPAPAGSGFACLWTQTVAADAAPHLQLVVPDGCTDLIWSDWDGRLHVAGPDTGPQHEKIPPGGRLYGVRFRPGLASPALGVPLDAVRDGRPALEELWGDEARSLAERLEASPDPSAVLAEAAAMRARTAGTPADPVAPAVAKALLDTSVKDAAVRLGLSERQLRRRSIAAFGYGPKVLQRILRFQRALRHARAGEPLADVAYAAGYADQAHLSHEVRDLAGVTLRELLSG